MGPLFQIDPQGFLPRPVVGVGLGSSGQAVLRAQQCPRGLPSPGMFSTEDPGTRLRRPHRGIPGSVFFITEIWKHPKGQTTREPEVGVCPYSDPQHAQSAQSHRPQLRRGLITWGNVPL